MKSQEHQERNFALVTYLDEESVRQVIDSMSVMHYAYAKHDKDEKEPHIHVLLRMNNRTTLKSVVSKFVKAGKGKDNGKDVNTLGQVAVDLSDLGEYLTHEGKSDKYQYPEDIIVSDDIGYFRGDMKSSPTGNENTAYQILEDLERGTAWREMAKRYGREIIINHRHYSDFLDMIRQEELPLVTCAECKYALTDMSTGEIICGRRHLDGLDGTVERKCAVYKEKDYV